MDNRIFSLVERLLLVTGFSVFFDTNFYKASFYVIFKPHEILSNQDKPENLKQSVAVILFLSVLLSNYFLRFLMWDLSFETLLGVIVFLLVVTFNIIRFVLGAGVLYTVGKLLNCQGRFTRILSGVTITSFIFTFIEVVLINAPPDNALVNVLKILAVTYFLYLTYVLTKVAHKTGTIKSIIIVLLFFLIQIIYNILFMKIFHSIFVSIPYP
jgi:hypothetical protein